jgi:glycosyltransferase involved in cell wall biosynthesis
VRIYHPLIRIEVPILVSICIPTYNRPTLVREAIDSVLAQTYSPIEIIIADDSSNKDTEQALTDLVGSGSVQYVHNIPKLGQSENVNKLFGLARGEFLMLLHDDDLLFPDAIAELVNCFVIMPGLNAAYGKQYVIRQDGSCDEVGSRLLNADFRRTADLAGLQRSALHASLTRQFPNDGFLLRASVAKAIGYRSDPSKVGVACDFYFGLRLAASADGFYFLDRYTATYRISCESVTAGNKDAHLIFDLLAAVDLPNELEGERHDQMLRFSQSAVNSWLADGNQSAAFRVFLSPAYGWRQRLSATGLLHAALLLCPASFARRLINFIRNIRSR